MEGAAGSECELWKERRLYYGASEPGCVRGHFVKVIYEIYGAQLGTRHGAPGRPVRTFAAVPHPAVPVPALRCAVRAARDRTPESASERAAESCERCRPLTASASDTEVRPSSPSPNAQPSQEPQMQH